MKLFPSLIQTHEYCSISGTNLFLKFLHVISISRYVIMSILLCLKFETATGDVLKNFPLICGRILLQKLSLMNMKLEMKKTVSILSF